MLDAYVGFELEPMKGRPPLLPMPPPLGAVHGACCQTLEHGICSARCVQQAVDARAGEVLGVEDVGDTRTDRLQADVYPWALRAVHASKGIGAGKA